jgi:hypothetical protein
MAKSIILYNLRDDVTDEDYKKWCEDYKGPLLLSFDSVNSFTLVSMLGGVKGNGKEGVPPEETKPPFKYVGILDSTNLEEWGKDRDSKKYKEEFFPQWFSKWVADFYVLAGMEIYQGESD